MAEGTSSSSADARRCRRHRPPRDFALDCLGRRAHSEGELSAKMARAGYDPAEIEATLAYLHSRSYLNDEAFARDYATVRAEQRHWGPARIAHRLRALRLSDAHIDAALAEVFPGGESARAARALSRFLRSESTRRPPELRRARAYRHLVSRGFNPEIAHELVSSRDFDDTHEVESQ